MTPALWKSRKSGLKSYRAGGGLELRIPAPREAAVWTMDRPAFPGLICTKDDCMFPMTTEPITGELG